MHRIEIESRSLGQKIKSKCIVSRYNILGRYYYLTPDSVGPREKLKLCVFV